MVEEVLTDEPEWNNRKMANQFNRVNRFAGLPGCQG